jgi:hypothetical protein
MAPRKQQPSSSSHTDPSSPIGYFVPNRRRTFSDPDPLTAALAPPPGETPAQRDSRLRAELDARHVSERIDASIDRDRRDRARRREIKILLLGQSESGKSTTLKRESLLCCLPRLRARASVHGDWIACCTHDRAQS